MTLRSHIISRYSSSKHGHGLKEKAMLMVSFKAQNDSEKVFLISLYLLSPLKITLSSVNPASDLFLFIQVFLYRRFANGACSNTHARDASLCSRGDLILLTTSYRPAPQFRLCLKLFLFLPAVTVWLKPKKATLFMTKESYTFYDVFLSNCGVLLFLSAHLAWEGENTTTIHSTGNIMFLFCI